MAPGPRAQTAPPCDQAAADLARHLEVLQRVTQGRPGAVRPRRPAALVWACVLTWTFSSLMAVLMVGSLAVLGDGDELVDQFERQQGRTLESFGLTQDSLVAMVALVVVALVLWCLAAIVLAALAFLGHNWARITLAVSSACAGGFALVMAVAAPPFVLLVAVLAVCMWLLLRPDVGSWFRR